MELVEIYNYYWNERSGEYLKKNPSFESFNNDFTYFPFFSFLFFLF